MDVYAGTFTRYFAGNWKTSMQQYCEKYGYEYKKIVAENIPEDKKATTQEIEETVTNWENQLVAYLKEAGVEAAKVWKDNNTKPYYTDKPDWDAFNALLLFGAAKLLGEDAPEEFQEGTEIYDFPLYKKAEDSEFGDWSLFVGACHWIPIADKFMMNATLPNGEKVIIGTTASLKNDLTEINKVSWNADEETILSWSNIEGYNVDVEIKEGEFVSKENGQAIYNTESLAKLAFSILWQAITFSERENVPIILDF